MVPLCAGVLPSRRPHQSSNLPASTSNAFPTCLGRCASTPIRFTPHPPSQASSDLSGLNAIVGLGVDECIACWVISIFGVFFGYEVLYSFPSYLSSFLAISSYNDLFVLTHLLSPITIPLPFHLYLCTEPNLHWHVFVVIIRHRSFIPSPTRSLTRGYVVSKNISLA